MSVVINSFFLASKKTLAPIGSGAFCNPCPAGKFAKIGILAGSRFSIKAKIFCGFSFLLLLLFLAVRGGSTAIHLLPLLDKDKQDQQKIEDICFIGFSDVSVLLNHTAEKGGWAIHSHVANTLRLASLKEQKLFFSLFAGNWQGSLAGENQKQLVCLKQGKTEGILMGGNLASIVSLVGSKWQVDFTDKMLFLEDTKPSP